MSPEAEQLDKELRYMHEVSPFSTVKVDFDKGIPVEYGVHKSKKSWPEIIGEWVFSALCTLILMAMGGAITVGYLSYAGWIQFASL